VPHPIGITAPFWFGFMGSAIRVAVRWRQFAHIEHERQALGVPHAPRELTPSTPTAANA